MAAAAGTDQIIKSAIIDALTDPAKHGTYKLTFTIGGKELNTIFSIKPGEISNKCIQLTDGGAWMPGLQSSLSSDSSSKKCFTEPIYLKENLPAGITQTDILQVISTKIKVEYSNRISDPISISIENAARLPPTKNATYNQLTYFSIWRITRGMDTLYEKYGYTHPELDRVKKVVKETPWSDIQNKRVPEKTLQELFEDAYPTISSTGSIADVMNRIDYKDADRLIAIYPKGIRIPLSQLIINILANEKKINMRGMPDLILDRDSEAWKKWDSMLQFVSFEKLPGSMGGGRRKTRRKIRNRHSRRFRKYTNPK